MFHQQSACRSLRTHSSLSHVSRSTLQILHSLCCRFFFVIFIFFVILADTYALGYSEDDIVACLLDMKNAGLKAESASNNYLRSNSIRVPGTQYFAQSIQVALELTVAHRWNIMWLLMVLPFSLCFKKGLADWVVEHPLVRACLGVGASAALSALLEHIPSLTFLDMCNCQIGPINDISGSLIYMSWEKLDLFGNELGLPGTL